MIIAIGFLQVLFFAELAADDNMTVQIVNPKQKARFEACSTILIQSNPSIQTGELDRVYFYANGASLGSTRREPWEIEWEEVPTGIYELTAKARDKDKNEVFSQTVLIFVDPVVDNDIVINGEFTCRNWPWILSTFEGAKASFIIDEEGYLSGNSMGSVEFEVGGTTNWHVQLMQYLPMDAGHTYEISYILDTVVSTNVLATLHLDVDPYTVYWSDQFALTEFGEFGPHLYDCDVTDPKTRLTFQIGGNEGAVFFDAIQIVDLNWEDTHFTAVEEMETDTPDYRLAQNYPNPFNPLTSIQYTLPKTDFVRIDIYNVLGVKVRTLVNGRRAAGKHTVKWNGENDLGVSLGAGYYICKLISGNHVESRKMLYMK